MPSVSAASHSGDKQLEQAAVHGAPEHLHQAAERGGTSLPPPFLPLGE